LLHHLCGVWRFN